MKAAVIYENGPPDVLRYEEIADPVCLDGCVVVDVEAISIEGGDLLARAASPPETTPHIVGYLCAGTVIEVGAGVDGPAIGEKVVALNANGVRVIHPDFPQPTGKTIPISRSCSSALLAKAANSA